MIVNVIKYRVAKIALSLTIILQVFINSCKEKSNEYEAPSISFVIESGYLSYDTILELGDSVYIKVFARSNSDEALTHFNYTVVENDTGIISVDSGVFANSFCYKKLIKKGIAKSEKWSFYVRDRKGKASQPISLVILLDSASQFNPILYIPSIVMGAQNNTLDGFYGLHSQSLYSIENAYNNQSEIDLVYYYDFIDGDENTIGSPGANIDESVFASVYSPIYWSVRNTTRYVLQSNLNADDFDKCNNDSLIFANTFNYTTGKRKAKNLKNGDVFSFITNNDGRKGLFKVINVTGTDQGTVEIAIKMQDN